MAIIRNRGNLQLHAIARHRGYKPLSKIFNTTKEAKDWALTTESEMVRGVYISRVEAELQALPRSIDGRVFMTTGEAVKQAFSRCCKRAGLVDLHFHDLRHESTTPLARKLPNIIELAKVTGHRDVNMLRRYYNITAEELAQKLD